MYIYRCEDSVDGIFTAIYDAWASGYGLPNVRIEVVNGRDDCYNIELFAQYIDVCNDEVKSEKVATSIRKKISEQAYEMVIYAALSDSPWKADRILKFLEIGFRIGGNVINRLGDEAVRNVFELKRYVGNETHLYLGFLRFTEVETGILFAKFEPKSDITGLIMPHFIDRFASENLIIMDMARKKAAFYEAGKEWFIMKVSDDFITLAEQLSDTEADYRFLWKQYFKSIAIEARTNYHLQRNMLRLHFRKYMTEFMSESHH